MPYKINKCPKCQSNKWVLMLVCGPLPEDLGNYIICDNCKAKTKIFKTRYESIDAWNGGEVNVV